MKAAPESELSHPSSTTTTAPSKEKEPNETKAPVPKEVSSVSKTASGPQSPGRAKSSPKEHHHKQDPAEAPTPKREKAPLVKEPHKEKTSSKDRDKDREGDEEPVSHFTMQHVALIFYSSQSLQAQLPEKKTLNVAACHQLLNQPVHHHARPLRQHFLALLLLT